MHLSASNRQSSSAAAVSGTRFRLVLSALMLLSFVVQGYLVQTHIHGLPDAFITWRGKPAAVQLPNGPLPLDNDQASCVLCQEFVQAGNYLTPAVIAVMPPMAVVHVILVDALPALDVKLASHSWRGRAPPHA